MRRRTETKKFTRSSTCTDKQLNSVTTVSIIRVVQVLRSKRTVLIRLGKPVSHCVRKSHDVSVTSPYSTLRFSFRQAMDWIPWNGRHFQVLYIHLCSEILHWLRRSYAAPFYLIWLSWPSRKFDRYFFKCRNFFCKQNESRKRKEITCVAKPGQSFSIWLFNDEFDDVPKFHSRIIISTLTMFESVDMIFQIFKKIDRRKILNRRSGTTVID